MAEVRTRIGAAGAAAVEPPARADDEAEEGTDEPVLAPNEVKLSNGKLVALKRLNAHESLIKLPRLLRAMGINPAGLDQGELGAYRTYFAITSIDGEPVLFPKVRAALEGEISRFYEDDWARIMIKYTQLSGLGDLMADGNVSFR